MVAEMGFANRLDGGRTSVEDREVTRKGGKTDGWTAVCARLAARSCASILVLAG